LIAVRVEVDRAGKGVHGKLRAAAHGSIVVTAAEDREPKLGAVAGAVLGCDLGESPKGAVGALLVDRHPRNELAVVSHVVGQSQDGLIGAGCAIKAPALDLSGPSWHLISLRLCV
jgi:hypothetical protein